MSRLATAIELHHIDGLPLTAAERAALVALDYEPADEVTELDVLDPERVAALAMVECGQCAFVGEAIDMCRQHDGEYLCPSCDYTEYIDYRWSR